MNNKLITPIDDIFLITRSSTYGSKPCDEAFEVEVMEVDRRCVDDPKKIPSNNGTDGNWYVSGTNHRIENGYICRDMGYETKWAVKITDIMEFVDKHGRCVVDRNEDGFTTIEIYDNYRE